MAAHHERLGAAALKTVVAQQQPAVAVDAAQRRLQVVRDDIGKVVELAVGGRQLGDQAAALHEALAARGVLTRLYSAPAASLRFGLPASEDDWQRLADALGSNHVSSSARAGEVGVPRGLIAEDGVEDGEELSSDGDESDFVRFSGGFELLEEGFEWRIVATG